MSAFEVRGEQNGVFMEHLLQHIADKTTVLEMLTKTFQGYHFYFNSYFSNKCLIQSLCTLVIQHTLIKCNADNHRGGLVLYISVRIMKCIPFCPYVS